MYGYGILGSNTFKNQVREVSEDDVLTDTEKMEAIDVLLNPILDFGITFQGTRVSYQGITINYMGVN